MNTTIATASEQQSLSHYYAADSLSESIFNVLSYMEFELEDILFKEFKQGLPIDLDCGW